MQSNYKVRSDVRSKQTNNSEGQNLQVVGWRSCKNALKRACAVSMHGHD